MQQPHSAGSTGNISTVCGILGHQRTVVVVGSERSHAGPRLWMQNQAQPSSPPLEMRAPLTPPKPQQHQTAYRRHANSQLNSQEATARCQPVCDSSIRERQHTRPARECITQAGGCRAACLRGNLAVTLIARSRPAHPWVACTQKETDPSIRAARALDVGCMFDPQL